VEVKDLDLDHQDHHRAEEAAEGPEWRRHQHLHRLRHHNLKVLVCKEVAEVKVAKLECMQLIQEQSDLVCISSYLFGHHGDQAFGLG
jgi:hypothetical protein